MNVLDEITNRTAMFHGTDERVPLYTLILTSKGYMEIVRKMLG